MRIRTIKPEFWLNEELSEVSEPALLVAVALLNWADDEGYFKANPDLIKGQLFPIRDLSMSIHGALMELSSVGYIKLCRGSDGRDYGLLPTFTEHQVISRPKSSKIKELCNFSDDSMNNHGSIHDDSIGKGKEGKGREQGIPPTPCEGVSADSVEESPAFQEDEETAGEGPEEKLVLSEQDCAPQNENPAAPPDLTKIRRAGRAEKKRRRVEVVTPLMARIGGMVPGRSADRRWTWQEYEALWDIQPLADADLALLERYYAADHPREQDYRRRQLMTLLNNWEAEVVKATRWAKENEGPGRPPGIRIL